MRLEMPPVYAGLSQNKYGRLRSGSARDRPLQSTGRLMNAFASLNSTMQCTGDTDKQRAVDCVSWQPTTRRPGALGAVISMIPPLRYNGARIVRLTPGLRL